MQPPNDEKMMMNHHDIRTLKLLEEFEKEDTPSQRVLAKKLDISLGLVNSFIKRLAAKGYFKATHIPKNRIRYILTPKGATEKTRLTYKYIQFSYQYYRESRRKLRRLFQDLSRKGTRSIVFYGISDLTEIAFLSLQETTIDLAGIVDERRKGQKFLGIDVLEADQLKHIEFDKILITSIESPEVIEDHLGHLGYFNKLEKIS